MFSIFLRSLVFNVLFWLAFFFWAIIALPTFAADVSHAHDE